MFKRIDHVEIVTGNLERTLDFYQNILGFKMKERIPMNMGPMREILFLTLADTMLEVIAVKEPAPSPTQPFVSGFRTMALEVEDMAKAKAYLKSKGIELSREPMDLGDSFRAEVKDPDGISIELRQWKR